MSKSLSISASSVRSPEADQNQDSSCKHLYTALIIIGAIGAILAAIGIVSFGGHQSWWTSGYLNNIEQLPATVMMAGGLPTAFFSLLIGISGSIKSHQQEEVQQIVEENREERGRAQAERDGLNARVGALEAEKQSQARVISKQARDSLELMAQLQTITSELRAAQSEKSAVASKLARAKENLQTAKQHHKTLCSDIANLREGLQAVQQAQQDAQRLHLAREALLQVPQPLPAPILALPPTPSALERSLSASFFGRSWTIVEPPPRSRVGDTWRHFTYDEVAEQKYRVVLDQYCLGLGAARIAEMKGLAVDNNNPMLNHLQQLLLLLESRDKNPRGYQRAVRELRLVIESKEYQTSHQPRIRPFIRALVLIRWRGVSIFTYLKDIVHLTTEQDQLPPSTLESFPELVLGVNDEVKRSKKNKKSKAALECQKAAGTLGLEDFCGNKNTPNLRCVQFYVNAAGEILQVHYVRHGSPTALGPDYYNLGIAARQATGPLARAAGFEIYSGEELTSDYKEYLKALAELGEGELYCNYQRRKLDYIENERTRAIKIDEAQVENKNLHVLTQPVEGDLFEHKGKYRDMTTFDELINSLIEEFFDTIPDSPRTSAVLPLHIRSNPALKAQYRQICIKLAQDVRALFFPEENAAVDASLSASVGNIHGKLEEIHQEQAASVQQRLDLINLASLRKIENPTIPERVVEILYENNELQQAFRQRIKQEIQTVEQLALWVPIDGSKTVGVDLQSEPLMQQLVASMLSSIAEIVLKDDLQAAMLQGQKAFVLANWQSFILLFYTFQKLDLKFRLNGVHGFRLTAYKTPCKDFLDRGGNQALVEDRLGHYMLGEEANPERMEEALYNLLGPPILVKKKEAIVARILPGLEVEKRLARLSKDPAWKAKLAAYTFGDGKWKLARLEVPKLLDQSGIPSLTEKLKAELEAKPIDEIPELFKNYAKVDLKQWEEIPFDMPHNGAPHDHPKKAELLRHPVINGDVAKVDALLATMEHLNEFTVKPIIAMIGQQRFSLEFALRHDISEIKLKLDDPAQIAVELRETLTLTEKGVSEVLTAFSSTALLRLTKEGQRVFVSWAVI